MMDKSSGKESPEKVTVADPDKPDSSNIKEVFQNWARFGETHTDGTTITQRNIDKWLQQADLLGPKATFTNADTSITFSKIAMKKKRIDFGEFLTFLGELTKGKDTDINTMVHKLSAEGEPGLKNVTKPVTSGAAGATVDRLTDTSLYTGSHKERFDEEGRGRGLEGREDVVEDEGYVQGYKDKDTYDKSKKA